MKRIGLFGGSFNPIHLGHLNMAEYVMHELELDKVLFIPTGINPFKNKKKQVTDNDRFAMIKMAIQDNPGFELCDIEIREPGKSYTINTVRALSKKYPDAELFFITGADIIFEITRWREVEALFKLLTIVSCCRPGYPARKWDKKVSELRRDHDAKIIRLKPPQMDLASSTIRKNIAEGRSVRYMMPDRVERFIADRGLYIPQTEPDEDLKEMIRAKLKQTLKPSRYQHTLNVVASAKELAKKYGCDAEKTEMAALLHDCAKNYSDEELLAVARSAKCDLDEVTLSEPQLLHGPVGSIVARREYGITDQDVLNAIAYHTTGRVGMSDLEKIIYLADFIEPGRNYPGVEELRCAVNEGLDQGMLVAFDNTVRYIASINGLIHQRTIEARNHLILQNQGEQNGISSISRILKKMDGR